MEKNYWQDIVWLTLLLVLIFGVMLGVRPLNTPDEGRYAEIAREMLSTHNYIIPTVNQVIFFDKPPLVYWLMAGSIKLFGPTMWAVRLIPAFFAWLGCIMVYVTARTLYGRQAGCLAALMLGTSLLYLALAHYVNMDMAIAVLISISLQCFLLATHVNSRRQQRWYLFLAYFASALAILTKGLIGLVFPLMVIGSWIVVCRQWQLIKTSLLLPGLILIAVIATPWFILVQHFHPEFLRYFFLFEQFTRFTGQHFNNPQSVWFYIPIIMIGFYPWIVFLVPALITLIRQCLQRDTHKNEVFILLWFITILLFFSIPHAKIASYILPVFPAIALLTARFLIEKWQNKKFWQGCLLTNTVISTLITLALIGLAYHSTKAIPFTHTAILLDAIAVSLIVGNCVVVWLLRSPWQRVVTLLITITLVAWLSLAIIPLIISDSVKPLTDKLTAVLKPTDQVISYNSVYQDLPFYLQRRIFVAAAWDDPELPYTDNSLGQMAWGRQHQPESVQWLITFPQFWQQWHSQQRLFVFIDRTDFSDFTRHARTPVYVIDRVKYTVLVSNQQV